MFLDFKVLFKYLLEGLAVAVAAFYIPRRQVDLKEIVLIALTAAAVFSILDQFSPLTGSSARQGAGFGIGLNQVGFGNPGHYHGFGYLADYPNDVLQGGQQETVPGLSCTCSVDSEYLKGQLCRMHSPESPNVSGSSTESDTSSNVQVQTNIATSNGTTTSVSKTQTEETETAMGVEGFDGFTRQF